MIFFRVDEKFFTSLVNSIHCLLVFNSLVEIKMFFVIFVTIAVIRLEHRRLRSQSTILHTHPHFQSMYLHQEPCNIEQVLDSNNLNDLIINCLKLYENLIITTISNSKFSYLI